MHSIKLYLIFGGLALFYLDNGQWLSLNSTASCIPKGEPEANPLLDDFRLCRITPNPIVGKSWVKMESGLLMDYQCAGPAYHGFAKGLEDLILEESTNTKDRHSWGRRLFIAPKINTSILIMGNSHTRQVVQALLCQYQDQLVDLQQLSEPGTFLARLQNNLTIYSVCNCPIISLTTWQRILERNILRQAITAMDAIVLGHFNTAEESQHTNYLKTMMDYHTVFPPTPKVSDIAEIYDGPLIWTGMFAHRNIPHHDQALEMIQSANRTNVRAVYAREYIERLPSPWGECSSDDHQVGTCVTDLTTDRYREGHRCMGARGGHPDLIAWDVVEILHRLQVGGQ